MPARLGVRGSCARSLLRLAAAVALVAVGCGEPARHAARELLPVTSPDLANAEESVRNQLSEKRAALDTLLAGDAGDVGNEELAGAFGDLGLTYVVYDFLEAAEACFDNARALAGEDFRWIYLAGYVRQTEGRLPEAIPLLEGALDLAPDFLPAYLRLGRAHLELGDLEAAQQDFERALAVDAGAAAAHEGLGRVAAATGDDAGALEHFERALELDPMASSLHYALGQVYQRRGETERAAFHLERSGDVVARIPDPLLNPLATAAESEQFYYMQGAEAIDDGDFAAAAASFTALVEHDPKSFRGYRGLAFSLERLGDLAGARAAMEKALESGASGDEEEGRKERAGAHRTLGGIAVLEGRDAEAITEFQRSLELDPEQPALVLRLGNALARSRHFEEALRSYDRFLELAPELQAVGLEKRATVLVNLGRRDEAIAAFRKAMEAAPADAALRVRYAAALEYLGEKDAAAKERARALGESGRSRVDARGLVEAGNEQLRAGDPESAEGTFRRALAADGSSSAARYGLASALGLAGRYDEAVVELDQLLDAEPRHSAARRSKVVALLLAGRWGEARVELQEALRLFSRDADLALVQVRLLSIAPDAEVRDGELALEIAGRVRADIDAPAVDDAYALALAAVGRTEEAARIERRLLDDGVVNAELARRRLEAFEAGRAWTAEVAEEIFAPR